MNNGDPRFPYPRFLRVPCVMVPKGSPPPLEWMRDHPHHVTVPGFFIPHPPSESNMELEPEHESEGQAAPLPEKPTYLVEIDYAGNWIARPVAPLTPRRAPWTEPQPEAEGQADPPPEEPTYEEPAPEPEVEPEPPRRPDDLRSVAPPGPRRARRGPPGLSPTPAARGIDTLSPEFTRDLMRQTKRAVDGMDRVS